MERASRQEAERLSRKGQQRVERGYWPEAADLFTSAIREAPDEPIYYYNLGLCIMQAAHVGVLVGGGIPAAVEHFRTAAGLKSNYAEAWLALGNALSAFATRPAKDPEETAVLVVFERGVLGALLLAMQTGRGGPVEDLARQSLATFLRYKDWGPDVLRRPEMETYRLWTLGCCMAAKPDQAHGTFFEDWQRQQAGFERWLREHPPPGSQAVDGG